MGASLFFPFSGWEAPWLAPIALALDLQFGDPKLPWPHPVCGIGAMLNYFETLSRKFIARGKTGRAQACRARIAGFISLGCASLAVWAIIILAVSLPFAGAILALYIAWAGLAMGCLLETGAEVLRRIESCPLEQAREAVSWLVSRHTADLDRPMLRKTLADTLSENYTDAFLAPYFWLLLGGPAALWIYKTVSTMDSQWGYLTPKWRDLGYAGAKTDDLLAWLPGRLSALIFFCLNRLAPVLPKKYLWQGSWPGFHKIASQARGMPSPNSGWPMAACAWLCGSRMAGPSVYFNKFVFKPWLGPPKPLATPWNEAQINILCRMLLLAAITGGFLCWAMLMLGRLIAI